MGLGIKNTRGSISAQLKQKYFIKVRKIIWIFLVSCRDSNPCRLQWQLFRKD